ncbi:IPT/TIG domain-containing protein [Hymenobacter sp. BT664]|uniref:IPT/TIG domain-containing protein n=1 Tax=Hymenobacter montanus TaxID=2771359 RepID=A0A927BG06_9BACT|nr:IPT/TIG domain-containing protein [Hymenobacter montanus]MBD2770197.1 IPT/TIG domain-containing protein [Hymenobacter montanus]
MKQRYQGRSATHLSAAASGAVTGLRRVGALLALALGLAPAANAQNKPVPQFFRADDEARGAAIAARRLNTLPRAQALTLDLTGLRAALATAPAEKALAARSATAPLVLALPLPNGTTGRFAIHEAPVMAPTLAARFPEIKTYAGVGLDDASASVRLDLTPRGFHAQVLTAEGNSFYIDPVVPTDTRHYLGFYKRDMNWEGAPAPTCGFRPDAESKTTLAQRGGSANGRPATGVARALASGSQLTTYRLALACTPEYSLARGNTMASVMAAEVSSVNRVVGVYERELAVRMVLVPNNDLLTILSGTGTPSPYTNNDGSAMLRQNQTRIDNIIGSANYDIGHVFSTGGGGIASLGSVCVATRKAQGVTGSPNPVGDAFDIDYVAHEMGHQFGGSHTFNGNGVNCGGGNREATTAWEPGSGSTIMAYAGICGAAHDLQPNSDAFFHTGSYEQMRTFIESTPCGTRQPTDNTPPSVTVPASGKTLPIGTPFKLTATGTDTQNDALTYLWEELDLGPVGSPTTAQVPGSTVPLFRSFVPSASGTRYFPRLSNLVANTTVIGERLPTVTRTLKFRCTVRDEHSGPLGVVGGVNFSSLVNLNVSSTAGPFVLTAPNTAQSWSGGSAQTITWDVANTTAPPVSCARVNLRMSLDGGLTYPVVLALNEANDGSAVIAAPNVATTQARVMVEAADNYFFDISNVDFTVIPVPGPTITSFSPAGGLVGTVVVITGTNFTGATAVAFNGQPAASFTVNSPTQITATVAPGTTTGPITVTTPTGTGTSATPFVVASPPVVVSFTPSTGGAGTSVVITGTGFTAVTGVQFNGTYAPVFTVNSATQITVVVPPGATSGPITVTTAAGTGVSVASFTVIPAPVISSFTPTIGPAGTAVVLTGNNFTGTTQVTFNGTVAPTFTVNSPTQITVTVPAGATTGPITVQAAGGPGSSSTNFRVPPVNDLCANALPLLCGQTVTGSTEDVTATGDPTETCDEVVDAGGMFYTIMGNGQRITVSTCSPATDFDTKLFVFSGTCGSYTCVGGNDDAASCSANSVASNVTFTSVPGTAYKVFVTGWEVSKGAFSLSATCTAILPAISSLSPTSGPVGTVVTITGTNFTGATGVSLNGSPITGFTVVNATTITFTVPTGATTGNIVVTTPGGTSSGVTFTVTIASATANATKSEFSVWPNPVAGKGILHVTLAAPAPTAVLTVHNLLGQLISTRTFSGKTAELATTGLPTGTYLLTVQVGERSPSIQRVVVE